jgi:hypothetical protein
MAESDPASVKELLAFIRSFSFYRPKALGLFIKRVATRHYTLRGPVHR